MEFVFVGAGLLFLIGYYLFYSMQDRKIRQAEKAVQAGDLDTALSIFMNSLRKNPNDIESLWHLGNINEEKKQYPEAIGYYTKLLEIGKESRLFTSYELYRRVGLLYHIIDRDQEALDFLMQAYNMIQSSKEVLETIAIIIYSQKFFHRAVAFFERAYQFLKRKPPFLKYFGLCLVMTDRLNESAGLLEESSRLDPRDFQTRFILAYVYFKIGAIQKARELVEDIVNSERTSLNSEQLYYSIKILFLIYLNEKNYDIARELAGQLKKINDGLKSKTFEEETNMAYIFFRIKQGYFDVALESISKNIDIKESMEGMDDEEKQQLRETRSYIYEMVSTLDKYKKESEKSLYTGNKPLKLDVDFALLESRAQDAGKELAKMYDEWQGKFVSSETLWEFFKPKAKSQFDPTIILDKYAEDTFRSLKKKTSPSLKETIDKERKDDTAQIDPCKVFMEADLPTFLEMSAKLVENMGLKVINQAVKIDPLAYSEGRAVDMLCEEKYQKDSRVLFCIRRWTEPIGYLSVSSIIQALKTLQAGKLILVSTSSLSLEASRAFEDNPDIQFFPCEEVANNFSE